MISSNTTTSIVLLFVCLSVAIRETVGCSCLQRSFEQYFSDSTTSVVGNVTSETIICDPEPVNKSCDALDRVERQFYRKVLYKVDVSTVFKGTVDVSESIILQTEVSSGLCGISLSVGTTYLFNLFDMDKGYFLIGSCSGTFVFDQLTCSQKCILFPDNENFCTASSEGDHDQAFLPVAIPPSPSS